MVALFRLVVADLVDFLVSEWRLWRSPSSEILVEQPKLESAKPPVLLEAAPPIELLTSTSPSVTPNVPATHEEITVPVIPLPAAKPQIEARAVIDSPVVSVPDYAQVVTVAVEALPSDSFLYPTTMYVIEESGTPLLMAPRMGFDERILLVSYGQVVSVQSYEGGYAYVLVQGQTGYIAKDHLTPHKTDVWPTLVPKTIYLADTAATLYTRKLLRDPFLAGRLGLPLQAGEYVLLRLKQDSLRLPWPSMITTPRTPGAWHQILRGIPGIHTTVMPLTDSIMEWVADDGEGRLVYVEAVLPDKTLRLSGVGMVVAGEYSEVTLPESVWREWRPVFIEVA